VTQALAAPLETGGGSELGARHVGQVRAQGAQRRIRVAHRQHLFGVGLPIGCKPQNPPDAQLVRHEGHELRLDQAPLVMAFLVPRVRKEYQHFIKDLPRHPIAQDLHCVVADDAQVIQAALMGAKQKPADAGTVHLYSEVVDMGIVFRQAPNHFPGAEAYFQATWRGAAKNARKVQRRRARVDAVGGP